MLWILILQIGKLLELLQILPNYFVYYKFYYVDPFIYKKCKSNRLMCQKLYL